MAILACIILLVLVLFVLFFITCMVIDTIHYVKCKLGLKEY